MHLFFFSLTFSVVSSISNLCRESKKSYSVKAVALLITDAETVVICACVKAELLCASSTIYIATIIWSSSSAGTQKRKKISGGWRNFTQPLCELLMGPEWQSGKQLSLSFTETLVSLYPILCSQALVGTVFCQQPVFQVFPGSPIRITALIGRADWD